MSTINYSRGDLRRSVSNTPSPLESGSAYRPDQLGGEDIWEKLKISMFLMHAYPRFLTKMADNTPLKAPSKVDYFYKNAQKLRDEGVRETTISLLEKIGGRSFRNYRQKDRAFFQKLLADAHSSPALSPPVRLHRLPDKVRSYGNSPWGVSVDHKRFWFGNKVLLSNARRRAFGKNKLMTDFEFHPRVWLEDDIQKFTPPKYKSTSPAGDKKHPVGRKPSKLGHRPKMRKSGVAIRHRKGLLQGQKKVGYALHEPESPLVTAKPSELPADKEVTSKRRPRPTGKDRNGSRKRQTDSIWAGNVRQGDWKLHALSPGRRTSPSFATSANLTPSKISLKKPYEVYRQTFKLDTPAKERYYFDKRAEQFYKRLSFTPTAPMWQAPYTAALFLAPDYRNRRIAQGGVRPTSPLRGKVLEDHFQRFKLPHTTKFLAPYEEFYKRTAAEDLLKNNTNLYFGEPNREKIRLRSLGKRAQHRSTAAKLADSRLPLVDLPGTF